MTKRATPKGRKRVLATEVGGLSLSMDDLLKRTGVTRRTLTRWIAMGLIPRPTMVAGEGGRGRRGVWEPWVLERVARINEMSGRGLALSKVAQVVAFETAEREPAAREEAAALAAYLQKSPSSGWVDTEIARASLSEEARAEVRAVTGESLVWIYRTLATSRALYIGLSKRVATEIGRYVGTPRGLEEALQLYVRGFTPVALWDGSVVTVVPDISVSLRLNELERQLPLHACASLRLTELLEVVLQGKGHHRPNGYFIPALKVWNVRPSAPDSDGELTEWRYQLRTNGEGTHELFVIADTVTTLPPLPPDAQPVPPGTPNAPASSRKRTR